MGSRTRAVGQGNFQKPQKNCKCSLTLVRSASFSGKANRGREDVFETWMERGLFSSVKISDVKQETKERIQITMRHIMFVPK